MADSILEAAAEIRDAIRELTEETKQLRLLLRKAVADEQIPAYIRVMEVEDRG